MLSLVATEVMLGMFVSLDKKNRSILEIENSYCVLLLR